jgi:hypothetical protein
MNAKNEKLKNACKAAFLAFQKLGKPEFDDIRSKIEYVIGSYEFDKNPVGLYEFGEKALDILKNVRQNNPRKISKKVIADLETSLKH